MDTRKVLNKIREVKIVKPADMVLEQIQKLISDNVIGPGDVLPSEKDLADRFQISKGYVREALKTLELYGVVRAVPGVGTIVSDLGRQCLNDFLSNYVQFSIHDYEELLEVRALVEPFTAYRAAKKATDEELDALGVIHRQLNEAIERDEVDLDLECAFHVAIANASHNSILATTMNAILPGLVQLIDELDITKDGRHRKSQMEHTRLYEALRARDARAAEKAMIEHMRETDVHFHERAGDIEEKRQSQRLARRDAAGSF
ncbi:MAG: FCD domain-containing protein [Planctomycetes bacterium]|nr:FCD domain-containing protein [Planctomycetota bacterium]MCD7896034.1 FCD domain-containing protein [Planctomycetaceae bacterium]